MTPEKWKKVKEIFNAVLDSEGSDREKLIADACGDDESVLYEVRSLFASHDASSDFIEAPAFRPIGTLVGDISLPSRIGQKVGSYLLESEIGRGGMGAVYLARRADDEFDQKAAVKLIKRGFDTDEIVARFRHERQILAALDHPNITRLLDGGSTDDGLPFIVMDFVDGLTLGTYCDKNSLSIVERLKIFLKVCSAISYAHKNLVVHRDLKPTNILVTADGEPKLLDFGIAKIIASNGDAETLTGTIGGFRAMTPEYASPEQLSGRSVTTATDVYSLGVVLFELLTGHRPYKFPSNSTDEVTRLITDTLPTKPSSVCRQAGTAFHGSDAEMVARELRGDLDNIVLMAMRKEPERRYSSVDQFADDIRRYLEGRPVIARDDTIGYRASKFVKRNKAGVAAGIGIAASLVGGLIASSRQARIAARQRDKARSEAVKAEKINQFLQKMLASADPRQHGRDVKVLEVLAHASESVQNDFIEQPEVAADLYFTIGTTYHSLGLLDDAEHHLMAAYKIRKQRYSSASQEIGEVLFGLAVVYRDRGDFGRAEPNYERAIDIFHRIRRTAEMAKVLGSYAHALLLMGRTLEAVQNHERALSLLVAVHGEHHPLVAETLGNLALAVDIRGDKRKAEQLNRRAVDILLEFHAADHPDVLQAKSLLASSVVHRDPDEATRIGLEVLEGRRRVLGDDHFDVGWALYELAYLNNENGQYQKAERYARELISGRDRDPEFDHPSLTGALATLGRSLIEQGRFEEAREIIEECRELRRKQFDPGHWLLATTDSLYGECLFRIGRIDEGRELLLDSYQTLVADFGEEHPRSTAARKRIESLL